MDDQPFFFRWVADDYFDEDLRSTYLKGFTYRVRDPNSLLATKVRAWLAEGKVAVAGGSLGDSLGAGHATLEGEGTVS